MARPRQPIELIELKGKAHKTKEEIKRRKETEIKAPNDKINPPAHLSAGQKKRFKEIAKELDAIGIMSNLDCGILAAYVISYDNYIKFTNMVNKLCMSDESEDETFIQMQFIEKAANLQDKAFKQCRSAASDLGLTISSRCKLVVPKCEEHKENKFNKFMASGKSG